MVAAQYEVGASRYVSVVPFLSEPLCCHALPLLYALLFHPSYTNVDLTTHLNYCLTLDDFLLLPPALGLLSTNLF